MATIREIQECQLDILKKVAEICDRHSIPYYLAYGTFLGAIRHNGFIPWDDDVDIYMGYDDLAKFKKICESELSSDYFFQDFESDPDGHWLFTKIRANHTYMPERLLASGKSTYHEGVWIDIFPLLDAAENEAKLDKQIRSIFKYQYAIALYEVIPKDNSISLKRKIVRFLYNIKAKWMIFRHRRIFESLASPSSDRVIVLGTEYGEKYSENAKRIALKQTLKKCDLIAEKYAFEDAEFYGLKDYDAYLRIQYGEDYMTPKKWSHIEDYSRVIIPDRSKRHQ